MCLARSAKVSFMASAHRWAVSGVPQPSFK